MDSTNRQIISFLLRDGRMTYQRIAKLVGLSSPAVKRRVDLMVARGEIAGFTAVIDPAALGWDTEAYVELYYQGNVSTSRLRESLVAIPQVVGVWTISGDSDALVHVMATGMGEIEHTVELIRAHPEVMRTRTAIVMSRVFERPRTEPT